MPQLLQLIIRAVRAMYSDLAVDQSEVKIEVEGESKPACIAETIGIDDISKLLFCTDMMNEATASTEAGVNTVMFLRPGNGALPPDHGLPTATTFQSLF